MRLKPVEEIWLREKKEWVEMFNFWHNGKRPPYKFKI